MVWFVVGCGFLFRFFDKDDMMLLLGWESFCFFNGVIDIDGGSMDNEGIGLFL